MEKRSRSPLPQKNMIKFDGFLLSPLKMSIFYRPKMP